jgi:pyruvate formate lyase activating enzyme
VTLSGGEPTFQPDFAEALLKGLKELGISTALDTCGLTTTHTLDRLLPYTDLVLFDLKLHDPALHRRFTGQSNERILQNLMYLCEWIRKPGRVTRLWVRTPLIPDATNTPENLTGIGRYLAANLDGTVARWELCAFNNLCREQYTRLGLEWEYARTLLMTAEEVSSCAAAAKSSGFAIERIFATGATRMAVPD